MNHTLLQIVSVAGKLSYPPRISDFTQTFWNGLRSGQWQTTCCEDCKKVTFPPKPVCPHCWSPRFGWKSLGAKGTLYSWTRIHAAPAVFASESPYTVGIVDLSEGVRLACRMVADEGVALNPGMPIEMVVLQYEDGPLFAARPVFKSQEN
ncbi:MAG: Zn-ribbon domain-containing OB-fold protein [Betaproteobacteria bacterium]